MDALLATLHDLIVGLGIGTAGAMVITGAAVFTGKWLKANRLTEEERLRPAPEKPVDFAGEIRAYRTRRDQEQAGERRRVA